MSDTFDRSCAHWSDEKRAEMDDFYALATLDYRELAGARNWVAWLRDRQDAARERHDGPMRLLDVACGSGKFPAALLRHGGVADAGLEPIDYALLDPSEFSIREARSVLGPPFVAGASHHSTLQDLDVAPGWFDTAWATHALYAIPEHEIDAALERMCAAVSGAIFVAHARADSHYLRFYERYLEAFRGGDGEPYVSAERIEAGFRGLGVPVETRIISYRNEAPETDRNRVEGFLQRCAFDDSVSLDQFCAHPTIGAYLEDCRASGSWRFAQSVSLIFARSA